MHEKHELDGSEVVMPLFADTSISMLSDRVASSWGQCVDIVLMLLLDAYI